MLQDAHQHPLWENMLNCELKAKQIFLCSHIKFTIIPGQCTGLDYSQLVPTQHIAADRLVMSCYFQYLSGGAISDSIKEGQTKPWLASVVFAACHHVPSGMFLATISILTPDI